MRDFRHIGLKQAIGFASIAATVIACGGGAGAADDPSADALQNATITQQPGGAGAGAATATGNVPGSSPAGSSPAGGGGAAAAPVGAVPATPMPFRGINLSGAEFGDALPGVDGKDYKFPNNGEIDYFMSKGMNTFRIGFKWERLQRAANGEFEGAYFAQLDGLVKYVSSHGAHAILNPHNFARYYGNTVGSTQVPNAVFADLWRRLAEKYAATPGVIFNLVNEPHDLPTEQWVGAANAAITAIRATGASNTIIVPGNAWTGAHSWNSNGYGTPNAVAMKLIDDPADNVIFEVHQYLDPDSSGGGSTCVSPTIGRERLAGFVKWLRDNGKKGFVGEFAGTNNATCNAAVTDMLNAMMESSDVLVGWLWWAAGPWWGNYQFALDPVNGQERPQMKLLEPYLF